MSKHEHSTTPRQCRVTQERQKAATERKTKAGGMGMNVTIRHLILRGASFGEGVTAEQGVLQLIGLRWDVIIFDAHMRIGCQMHPLSDWASFDDRRIAEMDGVHALRFWRQHKSALLTLAQRGNAPAAIANAEGGAA